MQHEADAESHSPNPDTEEVRIDWFIFTVGGLLLLMVVVPIVIAPDMGTKLVNNVAQFDKRRPRSQP